MGLFNFGGVMITTIKQRKQYWVNIFITVCMLTTMLAVAPVEANSAIFPGGDPFNGMSISYTVSGAILSAPTDSYNFTTSRSYKGRISGSTLSISGTVTNSWNSVPWNNSTWTLAEISLYAGVNDHPNGATHVRRNGATAK
jgi:hypothetical protein